MIIPEKTGDTVTIILEFLEGSMKKKWLGLVLAVVCCLFLGNTIQTIQLQQKMAEKILRFHVLANSDSAKDQALKLKVRDAVGAYMARELQGVDTLAESEARVTQNLDAITGIAQQTIRAEGYTYSVQAGLEQCELPEKTYGRFTFPAGQYEALRVVIGAGAGQNWWCVMYPNLCFSGSMYEVEENGELLQTHLSQEEYRAILREGNYRVQFKVLEILQHLRQKP